MPLSQNPGSSNTSQSKSGDNYVDITDFYDFGQEPHNDDQFGKLGRILKGIMKVTFWMVCLITAYAFIPGIFKLIIGISRIFFQWAAALF
jgi:hypothetical protein